MTSPAPHDEQTETDELTTLLHQFLYTFAPDGTVRPEQYVTLDFPNAKAAIEAWSRQQTARVLDELRMELHLYTAAHDRYMRDEALKLIAALRVGLNRSTQTNPEEA